MQKSIFAALKSAPVHKSGDAGVFEFQFGADDLTFAGHFPGRPILPGIFQMEMARVAAEIFLDCPLAMGEIRKAKFQRPILPDEIVRMELKLSENSGAIEARAAFSVDGQTAGETILFLCRRK